MKKGVIISKLLVILLMGLFMAGCGGDTKTINTGDGGGIKYSENVKKSVAIPAAYPLKEFPIYKEKETFISAIQENDKSFIVSCFTKDKLDDVVKYYEEALKDGQVINTTKDKNGLVTMGIKGTYTYTFIVAESKDFEGYPTSITINLLPADPAMAEALKKK